MYIYIYIYIYIHFTHPWSRTHPREKALELPFGTCTRALLQLEEIRSSNNTHTHTHTHTHTRIEKNDTVSLMSTISVLRVRFTRRLNGQENG
jgi:hypothetical protein